MRRRAVGVWLVGAAILALGLWLARSDCGLFCSARVTFDPVAILPLADSALGITTPPGVRTHAARTGGFQDRFVQIRLSASRQGLDALLALLDLAPEDLADDPPPYLGPTGPDWWATGGGGFRTARLASPTLDHLTLALRPEPEDPARWQIFLWGFET